MSAEFNKLSDIADVIDSLHKTPKYSDTGFSMVRCTDVKYGKLNLSDTLNVNDKVFAEFSRRYKPKRNDIIITRVGSYGITALVEENTFCLGQNTSAIVPKVNPRYLYFALNSPHVKNQIEFSVVGSTQKTLSLKAINNLEIPRFGNAVEGRIAEILGSLDDKIELNRHTNQTLEQMAQAIFKSWFVDFEPVKAKIEAKQNGQDPERAAMCAISGKSDAELNHLPADQLSQLATTAALFPDELVESELGMIPKGWKAGTIKDIATAKGGYAYKSKIFTKAGQPVVKIKNIVGDGTVDLSRCQCIDSNQAQNTIRFRLSDGDLLMAMTGATVGKIGLTVLSGKTAYLNQRVAKFESSKFRSGISWFLFCIFQRESVFEQVIGAAQGSAQPNISSTGIESIRLVVPICNCLSEFIKKVDPLFSEWINNQNENITLASTRDTLLPKLLSGEITVAETQAKIEAAV